MTSQSSKSVIAHFVTTSAESIEQTVDELWKIENGGLTHNVCMSHNDQKVLKLWEDSIKLKGGHYELPIPWKENVFLPNNLSVPQSRIRSLMSNLRKKGLVDRYDVEMKTMLENGYAEEVALNEVEIVE